MKDWLFYPLAILVVIAMTAYALSFGDKPNDTDLSDGYIVEGEYLHSLQIPPGAKLDIETSLTSTDITATMTSFVALKDAKSAGIHASLPPLYQEEFFGYPLVFTIEAKAGDRKPLERFNTAFFSQKMSSGWKTFELSDTYQTYSFEFTPKDLDIEDRFAFFGIWPDEDGLERTMQVRKLSIKKLNP